MSKYITGDIITMNKDAACAARFSFFAFLDQPSFDIADYIDYKYSSPSKEGGRWTEYRFSFTNVPIAIWERFRIVWVGEEAIYPYKVGCNAAIHKELRTC